MALSDLRKNLKEMAQLTLLSNKISEIQWKNMKMFPFVFFEKVTEVRIDYDLGHGIDEKSKEVRHKSYVTYYLTLDEKTNENALDKRFLALETSIRELFWKDVRVLVYFNDKVVFASKGHE